MSSDEERIIENPTEEDESASLERTTPVARSSRVGEGALGQVRQGPIQEETNPQRTLFGDTEEQQDSVEPEAEQEEQEDLQEQEVTADMTSTTTTTAPYLPTVFGTAADMFSTTPIDKTKLGDGACEHPRTERERLKNDPKALDKIKYGATKALSTRFGLPHFLVTGKLAEDEDNGNGAPTDEATEIIIGVAYRCEEAKIRMKDYDLVNAMKVPIRKDPTTWGATPMDNWDFTTRRSILDSYGVIKKEEILKWSSDCLLFGKSDFDRQDQDWLLAFARNSCTLDLKIKIDRVFEKLPVEHRAGCVYWWLMLDAIVKINDDIATGLQQKIKKFATNGLLSYTGENVEAAQIEIKAICTRLFERDRLPSDAPSDVIKGLTKVSHPEFKKIFEDLLSSQKNTLMPTSNLTGNLIEQIEMLWDEATSHYTTYVLNNTWVDLPSANYTGGGAGGVECDNCKGNHYLRDCPKDKDDERIARNRKARNEARGRGGRGGGRGGHNGGRGGRGGGRNPDKNGYSRGKWGAPKNSTEITRKIDGKVYCACKTCGWNKEGGGHTTGAHEAYMASPCSYVMSKNLKIMVAKTRGTWKPAVKDDADDKNDGGGSSGTALTALAARCEAYEKDTEDPQESAMAGMFGKLLRSLKE